MPVAKAAILGGALLLVTRAIKARKVYREIDGALLLMFAGLFVVVAGAEKVLLSPDAVAAVRGLHLDDVWALTGVTAVLSNIISNVPAVLALKPFVAGLADEPRAWLDDRHELDARRQFHSGRVGRQPDRGGARPPGGDRDFVPRLLPGRHPADAPHARARGVVAELKQSLNASGSGFEP